MGEVFKFLAIGLLLVFIWWMLRQITANNKVISKQTSLHRRLNDLQAEFNEERSGWSKVFLDDSKSLEEKSEYTSQHVLRLDVISKKIDAVIAEIVELDRQ